MIGTIEELRELVKDAASRRPHLTSRLEKAAFLLLLRPIERLDGDSWRVGSEDGLRYYSVMDGDCECTDYTRHGAGHLCKHRIALFLHRALEEIQPTAPREKNQRGAAESVPRGFGV